MKRIAAILAASVALSGCASMAPEYTQPEAPVPAAWPTGSAYRTGEAQPGDRAIAEISWQEYFMDPQLRQVIALALEGNRDLRLAALNIERSQALYRIRRSELFPALDANGNAAIQRIPSDLSATGRSVTARSYGLNLGIAAYELDLFGRIRSLKDQALDQYLATEQARRSVQISLIAEVANNYLTLAANRERLRIAQETLSSQESSYRLTQQRFDVGVVSALDVSRARTIVDAARVDIGRFIGQVAQDLNALQLVVGAPVPAELLPGGLAPVTALKEISPSVPSEVLQRRPDILQAEHQLRGANANIGAARAAFFPRITLTSSIGLSSNQLSGLFSGGAGAWSFLPQISVPIFNAGAIRANLEVAQVEREMFLAEYERSIQVAFREVADALAQYGTLGDQLAAQQSLVDASIQSHSLSDARYLGGVESYLAVLDSQRALYAAEQNLVTLRFARQANLVTLYKVLGGGA